MNGVLVKLPVSRQTFNEIKAELIGRDQADRVMDRGQALNLDEVALVAEPERKLAPAALEQRMPLILALEEALAPLVKIADAYDDNNLDDEARKFWGIDNEKFNTTPPEQVELYSGRGGGRLLTLADCLKARDVVRGYKK